MVRKMLSLTLAVATFLALRPLAPRAAQPVSGQVSGTALARDGRALAGQTVQLRDLATATVVGSTQTNTLGEFAFTGVPAGAYVIEVTDAGRVIAASGAVVVTPQSPVIAGITLVTVDSLAGADAEASSFWSSAAGRIVIAALAAGAVSAVVVAAQDTVASPSE
jgi:hypothetical protein